MNVIILFNWKKCYVYVSPAAPVSPVPSLSHVSFVDPVAHVSPVSCVALLSSIAPVLLVYHVSPVSTVAFVAPVSLFVPCGSCVPCVHCYLCDPCGFCGHRGNRTCGKVICTLDPPLDLPLSKFVEARIPPHSNLLNFIL